MGAVLAAFVLAIATLVSGQATAHEITVKVTGFKPLDKADELSNGDFFARVTINGASEVTKTITTDKSEVHPDDWKITKTVPAGVHKVRVELIDKDVSVDDPIDINRVDGKRDLDFTVDTRSCRIEGFSETYSCGTTIRRTGTENKKAEISFVVKAH
jgi:hypothetical protein